MFSNFVKDTQNTSQSTRDEKESLRMMGWQRAVSETKETDTCTMA